MAQTQTSFSLGQTISVTLLKSAHSAKCAGSSTLWPFLREVHWFLPLMLCRLFFFFSSSNEGNGTPLQYSCLENPKDGGAWKAAVHGVTEGRTRLSDFTFPFHFHALEKEMATHSSVLAWRIPGTGEPGGLPSMGSRRVGHDWSDLAECPFDTELNLILA